MRAPRHLTLAALFAAAVAIGFGIGRVSRAPVAHASAAHRYTLRVGDSAAIPAVAQRCSVYTEGGAPELFCARPRRPRHQVAIFRDSILVWKNGKPGRAVWSGKP